MKKALIITGPTATGKTGLAVKIAKELHGALISVDSIQVYKGCNIVSGKDIPHDAIFENDIVQDLPTQFTLGHWRIEGIPLYLTDVVEPTYNFSVSDFLTVTQKVLEIVEKKSKIPIFVGGSTLYINALLNPLKTISTPPDYVLRGRLANATVEELQAILSKYDKKKLANMNESDINNPRRLIRGIEVATSGTSASPASRVQDYNFLTTGLSLEREKLKDKIDKRVELRLTEGAIEEARRLLKGFDDLSPNVRTANGYRQLFEYLKGEATRDEAIEKWEQSEYLHAKNQMTYFKKLHDIEWFDVSEENFPQPLLEKVKNWSTPVPVT